MFRAVGVRSLRREIRLTRWRIQAIGEELDRWDSYDSAQLLPLGTQAEVKKPTLSRETAQELHTMLLARLEELEAAWERRN